MEYIFRQVVDLHLATLAAPVVISSDPRVTVLGKLLILSVTQYNHPKVFLNVGIQKISRKAIQI